MTESSLSDVLRGAWMIDEEMNERPEDGNSHNMNLDLSNVTEPNFKPIKSECVESNDNVHSDHKTGSDTTVNRQQVQPTLQSQLTNNFAQNQLFNSQVRQPFPPVPPVTNSWTSPVMMYRGGVGNYMTTMNYDGSAAAVDRSNVNVKCVGDNGRGRVFLLNNTTPAPTNFFRPQSTYLANTNKQYSFPPRNLLSYPAPLTNAYTQHKYDFNKNTNNFKATAISGTAEDIDFLEPDIANVTSNKQSSGSKQIVECPQPSNPNNNNSHAPLSTDGLKNTSGTVEDKEQIEIKETVENLVKSVAPEESNDEHGAHLKNQAENKKIGGVERVGGGETARRDGEALGSENNGNAGGEQQEDGSTKGKAKTEGAGLGPTLEELLQQPTKSVVPYMRPIDDEPRHITNLDQPVTMHGNTSSAGPYMNHYPPMSSVNVAYEMPQRVPPPRPQPVPNLYAPIPSPYGAYGAAPPHAHPQAHPGHMHQQPNGPPMMQQPGYYGVESSMNPQQPQQPHGHNIATPPVNYDAMRATNGNGQIFNFTKSRNVSRPRKSHDYNIAGSPKRFGNEEAEDASVFPDMSDFPLLGVAQATKTKKEGAGRKQCRPHLCEQSRMLIARVGHYNREFLARLGPRHPLRNSPLAKADQWTSAQMGISLATVRKCMDMTSDAEVFMRCTDKNLVNLSPEERDEREARLQKLAEAFEGERSLGYGYKSPSPRKYHRRRSSTGDDGNSASAEDVHATRNTHEVPITKVEMKKTIGDEKNDEAVVTTTTQDHHKDTDMIVKPEPKRLGRPPKNKNTNGTTTTTTKGRKESVQEKEKKEKEKEVEKEEEVEEEEENELDEDEDEKRTTTPESDRATTPEEERAETPQSEDGTSRSSTATPTTQSQGKKRVGKKRNAQIGEEDVKKRRIDDEPKMRTRARTQKPAV